MEVAFLSEPELEFGGGLRHIDIRFGLMNYGPFDVTSDLAPKRVRVGIVGLPENVEKLRDWLLRCRGEIPAKESKQPNLFPRFPGFCSEHTFYSDLVLESRIERSISPRVLKAAMDGKNNQSISDAVDIFLAEFRGIAENQKVDVFICAVPPEVEALMDPDQRKPEVGDVPLNFHDMLKARAMDLGVPVQLVLAGTYDPDAKRKQKIRKDNFRKLQDEATRAWNLHTAIYYKAGGLPWRLVRESSQLTTCYVGISFYRSLDRTRVMTSMAQVFDERGDGVVVRGGPVKLSKNDRVPHLTETDAAALLREALNQYRSVHQNLPARVVVHKTSSFSPEEQSGFTAILNEKDISTFDFLSFSTNDPARLFRVGAYPPLRGTMLSMDETSHLLYTKGSVDFYETYPGMYVPVPLLYRCECIEQTSKFLGREILALSKMNWNDTKFDGGAPITVVAANRVGDILRYLNEGERIAPRYSYYM